MSHVCSVCQRRMKNIQQLPPEIQSLIFSHLEGRDLKSARLTCHTFQKEAAPFLFTTAYVAARRGVLNNFTALADHPVLSTYVTEVIYDSSWFEDSNEEPPPQQLGSWPPESIHRQKYSENFAEQERIQKEELRPILTRAFRSLTKVQRVVYADLWRLSCLHGDRLEDLGPDFRFGGCDFPQSPQHKSDVKLEIPWCAEVPDGPVFRRQNVGLYVLLRALSSPKASPNLTELSIGNGTYSCGASWNGVPQLLLLPMADSLSKPNSNFLYLRKFEVNIGMYSIIDHEDQYPLGRIMEHLHHLEDLRIVGPASPPDDFHRAGTATLANPHKPQSGPEASLANTLGQNTWSKLVNLELQWFESEPSGLVDFLARHISTLNFVNLYELQIWDYDSREDVIRLFQPLTPNVIAESGLDSSKRSIPLLLDYLLYDGEAKLILRGSGRDDEDDYDEDQVSSYSHNGDFEQEERWSSEELDFSEGSLFSDSTDDSSDIADDSSRCARLAQA
ncbi:MAG: hypothetical protein Q9167_007762 [Letrouitia subvulpina]